MRPIVVVVLAEALCQYPRGISEKMHWNSVFLEDTLNTKMTAPHKMRKTNCMHGAIIYSKEGRLQRHTISGSNLHLQTSSPAPIPLPWLVPLGLRYQFYLPH